MSHFPAASKVQQYFTQIRLLASGDLKASELSELKAFFQSWFAWTNSEECSHAEIQRSLMEMRQSAEPLTAARAEACLRCFVSHFIWLACHKLEQRYRSRSGFRAIEILPHLLTDHHPLKSRQEYEQEYAANFRVRKQCQPDEDCKTRKDYKPKVPLAIRIVERFNPDKGGLAAWTELLTLQQAEVEQGLREHGIQRKTDWALLNHATPTRIQRLLSGSLTPAEIESMGAVLESYHEVYRKGRQQSRRAGQPCKAPTPEQLAAMVNHLRQRGRVGYSSEQVLQTLQTLAAKLRNPLGTVGRGQDWQMERASNTRIATEETHWDQLIELQQELLRECLPLAVAQVLKQYLQGLEKKTFRQNRLLLPKDQVFLQAMRLYYCEGRSMTEIAHRIGRRQEYQVSRLLSLKQLRTMLRDPWLNLACERVTALFAGRLHSEQVHQYQQQIQAMIALQIDQRIAEETANSYCQKRVAHTMLSEGFRYYLASSPH